MLWKAERCWWFWNASIAGISHSTMALMKNGFFEFLQKSVIWRLFSLTKNSCFLNFWELHKIGDSCASLEHEEFGKATCNESLVSISRLGKLISTRYSTYSSTMGFFGLKTAKISDFCHFPKKKLNFEVFLAQIL